MIELDGSRAAWDGLTIFAGGSTIRGLIINRFYGFGIYIYGNGGNVIEGNYIGTDVTGSTAMPNHSGIVIETSDGNRIGTNGDGEGDASERNVISGNQYKGVHIGAFNVVAGNIVAGNYIGTDATGTQALSNGSTGLTVYGDRTRIGTNADGISDDLERNVISANGGAGVSIWGEGNVVAGNYVGTNADGTAALGNRGWGGVTVGSSRRTRIGTNGDGQFDDAERNVISGNERVGVGIWEESSDNVVAGNFIGTDKLGKSAVPNLLVGVDIWNSRGNRIGTNGDGAADAAERNVISGNGTHGVHLGGGATSGNLVAGNYIGTDADGTSAVPNAQHGMIIRGAQGNQIGGAAALGNTIAFNGGAGVVVIDWTLPSTGNSIRANAIYANGGLGIDLNGFGANVTWNDPLDADSGANNLQNFPVLSAADSGSATHVAGALNSTPNTTFTIDFYANTEPDPSGYGEGERWLGSITVSTDESGNAEFDAILAAASDAGETITATATDPSGNTSEFSGVIIVTPPPLVDLGGRVFDDHDNDGLIDDGEPGIAGVTLDLYDQLSGAHLGTSITHTDGSFVFEDVPVGTFYLVETQPAGYLDGDETAGGFGGTVYNLQDSNAIYDISIQTGDPDGSGYNFGEIQPSRIQGFVWEDFNDDGEVDFGEKAIDGVQVHLTGTDDRGNAVDIIMATNAQGLFEVTDLRPGDYTLAETQPAGYVDGKDSLGTVNGNAMGDATVNDQFSGIILPQPGLDGVNYNFGERPAPGGQVTAGQTATIGFWQNKNGQALIKALNGASTSTQLGNWLAATFPKMYAAQDGASNLSGKTNTQVADFYTSLFKRNAKTSPGGPPKLDAQVMAAALAVYVTNADLAGTTAASYGFRVTEHGVGVSTFDVGDRNRAAFGLSATDSTVLTVMDILLATDSLTHDGLLYDMNGNDQIDGIEQALRTMANEVYTAINERGHI